MMGARGGAVASSHIRNYICRGSISAPLPTQRQAVLLLGKSAVAVTKSY